MKTMNQFLAENDVSAPIVTTTSTGIKNQVVVSPRAARGIRNGRGILRRNK